MQRLRVSHGWSLVFEENILRQETNTREREVHGLLLCSSSVCGRTRPNVINQLTLARMYCSRACLGHSRREGAVCSDLRDCQRVPQSGSGVHLVGRRVAAAALVPVVRTLPTEKNCVGLKLLGDG